MLHMDELSEYYSGEDRFDDATNFIEIVLGE